MATATLQATPRTATGKGVARKLRQNGQVPAVVYGHGREPQSLTLVARDLDKMLDTIAVSSTVVELAIEGSNMARTLIREIQRHPFRRQVLHVDFQELVAGETVTVDLPLVFVGTPAGIKEGGVLEEIMREVTVEVDPSNIPNHIDVDVSELTIGHSVHIRDLKLPAGVTILDDESATVCAVLAAKAAAEPAPEAAEAAAEPELIRKPKGEESETK